MSKTAIEHKSGDVVRHLRVRPFEKDECAELLETAQVARIEHRTASGGDHSWVCWQFLDHQPLLGAKERLAAAKESAACQPGSLLDQHIGVDEGKGEVLSERPAQPALAAPPMATEDHTQYQLLDSPYPARTSDKF
jgi:hypothetical protein